ncbi:MAG: translation initiation factor IF-2 [Planctomycetota bacterium]|nr:translation initiation factor IF-2 [Planctomycetota bacterium]
MGKRFYQIALDLGLQPRSFIRELSDVGLSVGNQMVIIPDELESRIREMYDTLHPPAAPPEPVAPPAPVAEPVAEELPAEPVEEPIEAPLEDGTAVAEEVPAPAAEAAPAEEPAEAPEAGEQDDTGEGPAEGGEPEPPSRRPPRRLVPTLDPRAGRLVKDAPVGGVPTLRPRPRREDAGPGGFTPQLPRTDRAPGQRRDGGRRVADRYRGKRGKETFTMRRRGRGRKSRPAVPHVRPSSIVVELPITVKGLGELSSYKAADIVRVLFKNHGMMVTPNSSLDKETVETVCLEFEIDVSFKKKVTAEDTLLKQFQTEDDDEDLRPRPPVVAILGHVDHGKTTLLDYIRQSDVAAKEAGGITQHIGAAQVTLADGRKVTFLDTPGHEAFTEMRARGAQVTDIVILIVAADDGVMPQTVEAISHAKAAGVEIVVAVTKVDRDNARPDRAKQQLAEHEIYVEGYGGDVSVFEVSGITGQGVPELLEHLALMAEVDSEKYRANPDRKAQGTVIEAQNSPKRGILTTVLVQNGTLQKGDAVIAGEAWGKVRGMFDDRGGTVKQAGPSTPVEIIGLDTVPDVGSKLYSARNAIEAKKIAQARRDEARALEQAAQGKVTTLDDLFGKIEEGKTQDVNLVVKADVKGSLEPLKTVLERLGNEEVRPKIIHSAVGAVNESDVVLASASNAWVIGFHVNVDAKARDKAKQEHVEIRTYKVIYDIESDVLDLLEGRLAPEMFEEVTGHAEVLQIFTFSKIGNIAGCRVRDGIVRRDSLVRVKRGDEIVHEGAIASLRREKDTANEVREGLECGLTIKGWDDLEVGDIIETYKIEAKKRTLADKS